MPLDWTLLINTALATSPLLVTAIVGLIKIMQVEKNTNSMKDALVAATKVEATREGIAQGKAQGRELVAAHAAGVKKRKR